MSSRVELPSPWRESSSTVAKDGTRMVRLRSGATGVEATLDLRPIGNGFIVHSMTLTSERGSGVTGGDLRSVPLAAITVAYANEQNHDAMIARRVKALEGVTSAPLDPLPLTTGTDRFHALVARQYDELTRLDPECDPATRMTGINGVSLTTTQRWITEARRAGFLPAVQTGARRGRPRRRRTTM